MPSEITYGYSGKSLKFEYEAGESLKGVIDGIPLGYGKDVLTGRNVLMIEEDKIKNNSVIKITVDINGKV